MGVGRLRLNGEELRAEARALASLAERAPLGRLPPRAALGGTGDAELDRALTESFRALQAMSRAHRRDVAALAAALAAAADQWDQLDIYLSRHTG